LGCEFAQLADGMSRSKPVPGGPRRYALDPTWPRLLPVGLPPAYVAAGGVELCELAQHGSFEVTLARWPFTVDAVRLLASVPLHAFRSRGQWPYSGNLKPRTAAIYRLKERDVLTITVRQGRAGQMAVLPLRLK
jgi:hypothetical protein